MSGECHGHIFMDGRDYPSAAARHRDGVDQADIRAKLAAYRAAGIGFFRDGGDPYGVSLAARAIAPEYGIDYRSPAFAIHKQGLYGGIVGRAFETLADYRALVREADRRGADFIKIMASGIMDFNQYGVLSCDPLDGALLTEMIRIAHGEGFAVMAHANGDAVRRALEAGADSIEHGFYADDDCADVFAQTGAFFVPTFTAVANLIGDARFPAAVVPRIHSAHQAFARLCMRKGVRIACGSDAGAYGVSHPQGAADEAAQLGEVGVDAAMIAENERRLAARFKRDGV